MLQQIDGIPVQRSFRYPEYRAYLDERLKASKGDDETELLEIGRSLMDRLEGKLELGQEFRSFLEHSELSPRQWVVLTEPWCADSAQLLPVIRKASETSPYIDLRILLRDEHPELMELHTTDGKRAIPKLLEAHPELGTVHDEWGPRPLEMQREIEEWKAETPELSKEELHKRIRKWYAKDKGAAVQNELLDMLRKGMGTREEEGK